MRTSDFRVQAGWPALAVATLLALPASAQQRTGTDYPTRPVRIVVAQAAGSGVDIMARTVAAKLTESFGQQVIVENRAGANGIIGHELVAKAKPDGYTLILGVPSALTMNPFVYKSLPYDPPRDFVPITQTATNTFVLVVNPSLPVRNPAELVALGKRRPGDLVYASFGIGNQTHLAGELFRLETGLNAVHVPYKGEAPAVAELMGGQVVYLFAPSQGVAPHIRAGRLRLLASLGEKRATAFPETPTMVEAGFRRVVVTGWSGLLAPTGTPPEIIDRLHRETARHLATPELRERLSSSGAEPVGSSPAEFAAFIRSETDKWSRVVRDAGLANSQ